MRAWEAGAPDGLDQAAHPGVMCIEDLHKSVKTIDFMCPVAVCVHAKPGEAGHTGDEVWDACEAIEANLGPDRAL